MAGYRAAGHRRRAEVAINRYFLRHPDMVLGTWSRKDTLYGGDDGYSVTGNGDLARQLQDAIGRLPEFAPLRESPAQEELRPRHAEALAKADSRHRRCHAYRRRQLLCRRRRHHLPGHGRPVRAGPLRRHDC